MPYMNINKYEELLPCNPDHELTTIRATAAKSTYTQAPAYHEGA